MSHGNATITAFPMFDVYFLNCPPVFLHVLQLHILTTVKIVCRYMFGGGSLGGMFIKSLYNNNNNNKSYIPDSQHEHEMGDCLNGRMQSSHFHSNDEKRETPDIKGLLAGPVTEVITPPTPTNLTHTHLRHQSSQVRSAAFTDGQVPTRSLINWCLKMKHAHTPPTHRGHLQDALSSRCSSG